jgi:hypothetical protein
MPPRMTISVGAGGRGAVLPIEATFSSVTGGSGVPKAMIEGLIAINGTAAASSGGGATATKLDESAPKEAMDGVSPAAGGAIWTRDEATACPLVSAPSAKLSNNSRNGSLRRTLTLQRPKPMRAFAGRWQRVLEN